MVLLRTLDRRLCPYHAPAIFLPPSWTDYREYACYPTGIAYAIVSLTFDHVRTDRHIISHIPV